MFGIGYTKIEEPTNWQRTILFLFQTIIPQIEIL